MDGSTNDMPRVYGIEEAGHRADFKLEEIVEENGKLRIKVEGKDDIIANKALLSIGRVPDLEVSEMLNLN